MELPICPSSLTPGYTTYSPEATKALFDGVTTSHMLPYPSPSSNTVEAKEAIKNSGRLSLSGAQPKFGMVTENGSFRYTNDGEQSTYILKPRPVALYILNPEFCAANENLTMQIAAQAYRIETALRPTGYVSLMTRVWHMSHGDSMSTLPENINKRISPL